MKTAEGIGAWHNQYNTRPLEECVERAKRARLDFVIVKHGNPVAERAYTVAGIPWATERYVYTRQPEHEGNMLANAVDAGACFAVINAEEGEGGWGPGSWSGIAMRNLVDTFTNRHPNVSLYACLDTRGDRLSHPYQQVALKRCDGIMPMCFTPETRVLMWDLRWCPLRDIEEGDELLAFDEAPPSRGGYRHWRKSVVTRRWERTAPLVALHLSDGSLLRCTPEHPFLAAKPIGGGHSWREATQLIGARGGHYSLLKPLDIWQVDDSSGGGYLAGALDCDGHVTTGNEGLSRGVQMGFTQKPGAVLAEVESALRARGFDFSVHSRNNHCELALVRGGLREVLRLLGTVRPLRLLPNIQNSIERFGMRSRCVQVEGIEPSLEMPVVGIETTTHTYLAEGFAVHNCYPGAFRPGQPPGYIAQAFRDSLYGKNFKGGPVYPVLQSYGAALGPAGIRGQAGTAQALGYSSYSFYTLHHATDAEWDAVCKLKPEPKPEPDSVAGRLLMELVDRSQCVDLANHGRWIELQAKLNEIAGRSK